MSSGNPCGSNCKSKSMSKHKHRSQRVKSVASKIAVPLPCIKVQRATSEVDFSEVRQEEQEAL